MNKTMFSGWKDVFFFTFKQGFGKRYKIVSLILALILLAVGLAINIVSAIGQKKDDNISPIEKVYVIDESGIGDINWHDSKQLDREQFPNVTFEQTSSDIEELGLKLKDNEATSVITKITKEKNSYRVSIYIPYGSEVTTDDGENLAKAEKAIVQEGLIRASDIDKDKISYVVSSMDTEFSTVGEEAKDTNELMLTTVVPMFFMLGLYFMVIIYGQSMGQIVSVEKSSKLMETLLVMTRPYGLIFGKIIATSALAIIQIALWVVALLGGFVAGDVIAHNLVYSAYENNVLTMLKDVASQEASKAFSVEAIILTLIAVCLAFIFYCMLAGAISSFASKADELGTVMMFYNMFIMIGFIGSYLLPMMIGKEWIKVLIRLIPMSAAFLIPSEILVGTVSTGAGVVYLIVLFGWIILTAVLAGKIYRDQVFYRGQSLKYRLPWMKNSKEDEDEEQWQILHDEAGRPLEKSQRIGYFFIAVSPLVIFFIIQILTSLVLTNVMTRIDLKGIDLNSWEAKDFADYYHGIEPLLNPMTVMVSHILIITTFGLWMYFVFRINGDGKQVGIKSLPGRKIAVIVGVCVAIGLSLCAFANGTVAIESALMPSIVEDYIEMANSSGFGISPFAIFAAVCLAPIGEEFLCRGVCLYFGKKALGKFWYANILQALLFGILHMNWVQGIYAFFIGLVLGVLVEKYKSLLPSVLVHFVVNFSSSTWVPKVFGDVNMTLTIGIVLVTIPGIIVITYLIYDRMSIKREQD